MHLQWQEIKASTEKLHMGSIDIGTFLKQVSYSISVISEDYESPNLPSEFDWSAPMVPAFVHPHLAMMDSGPVQIDSHMSVV